MSICRSSLSGFVQSVNTSDESNEINRSLISAFIEFPMTFTFSSTYKLKFIKSDGTTQDDIACRDDVATPTLPFKTTYNVRDDIESITV